MKRAVSIMLLLCLLLPLAAEVNMQKIYHVHSDTASAVRDLAISAGVHTPSSSGPWSQAELLSMLKAIDRNRLDQSGKVLYDGLYEELSEGRSTSVSLDPGLSVNIEGTVHTNASAFTDYDWVGGFGRAGDPNYQAPMVFIPYSITIGKNIYMYSELQMSLNRTIQAQMNPIVQGEEMTFNPLTWRTDILFLPPSVLIDFNMNFPYRAIIAAGSDNWYFSIGREKLSWGPGVSGNLLVGDQLPYHNNARFVAFTDHFKYTFSVSSFIHPQNYTYSVKVGEDRFIDYIDLFFDQDKERTGTKAFIAHRAEYFTGRFTGALTESIIYQTDTGAFDLSVLSPLALFHNYYIRHNANSMLSLELEYAAADHLSIYGVLLIDEFNFPTEFSDPDVPPPAMGFQLGAKTSWILDKGIIHSSIEGVYTDPYLYIRDDGSRNSDGYGINAIVAFPDFINSPSTEIHLANYELMFLGYRYGNDIIAINWNTQFKAKSGYDIMFDFTYMANGVKDKYTRWKTGDIYRAPSSNPGESYLTGSDTRNAVSHFLIFTLQGGYSVTEHLSLDASLRQITVFNAGNRSDGGTQGDFQLSAKISYTF
ncbi:MAG: hypothetical protein ACI4NM_02500 [Bullifex sp.]